MIDPVDTVTRSLPVASNSPIALRYVQGRRHCTIVLEQDLFSDWVLTHIWSDKAKQRSGMNRRVVLTFDAGYVEAQAIVRQCEKEGMALVRSTDNTFTIRPLAQH